ncbi:MAG: response regulator [Ignavibacteriales bacterium]|nr:response regulator [Ignavibacteriales bacterium]
MKLDDVSALIIDDSDHIRALFSVTMRKAGIAKLFQAVDGEDGIAKFKQHAPSIVFLDNMMPKVSGMEVLRQIKALNPQAIVVMISAVSNIETVQEAKATGANYYIVKPYAPDRVIEVMYKLLNIEKAPS